MEASLTGGADRPPCLGGGGGLFSASTCVYASLTVVVCLPWTVTSLGPALPALPAQDEHKHVCVSTETNPENTAVSTSIRLSAAPRLT